MKRSTFILLVAVIVGGAAQAKVDLVTLPTRDTVQLTIYNSADMTLVREARALTVKEGDNKLQFSWENTLIDPTSLEMLPKANAGEIDIADLTYPPRVRNLGLWNVRSDISGKVPVEISYLTSGLSWRAFYMGTLTEDEKTMRLQGYVRVTNNSGEDYEEAQVRLIVGKVHILDEIADLARRQYPYDRPGGLEPQDGSTRFGMRGKQELAERFDMLAVAAPMAPMAPSRPKAVVKEGLSEYFLYTIEGTETIPTGWSKRLISFDIDEIPVVNLYKFEQDRYGDSAVRFLSFKNDKEHELGDTPIPGGVLKVYRNIDSDKHLSYTGQSSFKYIPVDEDVELNLGPAADVIVEPTLIDFKTQNHQFDRNNDISGWQEVRTFRVRVKNTRGLPVKIEITRNFDTSKWELTYSGDAGRYEKVDLDTVKFTLVLEPETSTEFQYVLTTTHEEPRPPVPRPISTAPLRTRPQSTPMPTTVSVVSVESLRTQPQDAPPPPGVAVESLQVSVPKAQVFPLKSVSSETPPVQNGLRFDGENVRAIVNDNPDLDLTGSLTLEAWIKFQPGGTENPRIISKGWEARTGYELLLLGTGEKRRLQFAARGLGRFNSSSELNADVWHYLAATYDERQVRLFIDGILDTAHKAQGTISTNDAPLHFGWNSQNDTDRYKGEIAKARIWRRALSEDEIKKNVDQHTQNLTALVGWWDFRQYRDADIVPDISRNGNYASVVRTLQPRN